MIDGVDEIKLWSSLDLVLVKIIRRYRSVYDKFVLNERCGYFIWNNELPRWYIKRNEIPTNFAVIYTYIHMRSINEE